MSENINLIGAEDVLRAGHNMAHAAAEMKRAADLIDATAYQQRQFMTQWLSELNAILQENKKS